MDQFSIFILSILKEAAHSAAWISVGAAITLFLFNRYHARHVQRQVEIIQSQHDELEAYDDIFYSQHTDPEMLAEAKARQARRADARKIIQELKNDQLP